MFNFRDWPFELYSDEIGELFQSGMTCFRPLSKTLLRFFEVALQLALSTTPVHAHVLWHLFRKFCPHLVTGPLDLRFNCSPSRRPP
jgi:hypothetical protein